jgi:hypothetical protein
MATFEEGEEFFGRILIASGEWGVDDKFWLWPETMNWHTPHEDEKIGRLTRKRLTKMLMAKDDCFVLD